MTAQSHSVSANALLAHPNSHRDERKGSVALNWRLIVGGGLVCLGYYLGAKLGFALTLEPRPVSVMWPPNSILLAALLLAPIRSWWFLLACAVPAHFAAQLQSNVPPTMMTCWLISNFTEALIGAGLTRLIVGGPFRFVGLTHAAAFLLCGVFLAPFLSSFLDAAFVRWNDWGQATYREVWRIRFFSNVLASLAIAPVIVVWARTDYGRFGSANWKRFLEATLLAVGLLVVELGVFVGYEPGPKADLALLYVPLPFLVWAAIRFGDRGATMAGFVTSLIAIGGAALGHGPFSAQSPEANALSLQLFLIVVCTLSLLLSVVMGDREKAQERFAKAFRSSSDGIIISRHRDGHIIELNKQAEAFFGLPRAEVLDRTAFDLNIYFCEAGLVETLAHTSGGTSLHNLELPFRTKAGQLRQALISTETEEIDGELCLIVVIRDITDQRHTEEEARHVSSKLITAQEDERKRIARELHDHLSQHLAMLSVEMEIVGRESEKTEGPVHKHLEAIGAHIKDLSSEVHRLSYQLHPAKLDQLGLVIAARTFCREVAVQFRTLIHFEHADVPRDLDPYVALCHYRVLQEVLWNSVRHSGAAEITVHLAREAEHVRLVITDSGKGFDVQSAMHNGGLGLVSMRERVRQVNGSIDFKSAPGAGTRIEVMTPLIYTSPENHGSSH